MKKIIALISAILLLMLPFTSSYAASKTAKFTVTVSSKLVSNNSVGHDWSLTHTINGKEYFKKSDKATITLTQGEKIKIVTKAIENDSYPDIGENTYEFTLTSDFFSGGFYATVEVTVIENKGRYKNNAAVWEVTYDFNR